MTGVEATLVLDDVVDDTGGTDVATKALVETGVVDGCIDEVVTPEDNDVGSARSPSVPAEHPVRTTTDTSSVSRRRPDMENTPHTFQFC